MVRITEELLKKRAEHNDGILSSLQEITLHQYNIERIELIQSYCKHLKILYLQNNLIERIENLHKLKELQYLNLALNNISQIEGLQSCESLQKLDLTLNFIDLAHLEYSIRSLQHNRCLRELHLTGNPCTDWPHYRLFVIHLLPQLTKLDSLDIKKSEVIKAKQSFECMLAELTEQSKANEARKPTSSEHTAAARKATYCEEREREQKEKEEEERKKKSNPFRMPPDIIKQTREKLSVVEQEGENGELPKQRNLGKYEFRMQGADDLYAANIVCVVEAPKYLDTSEIFVDVHPLWFQVIIRKKSLLLHLPAAVKVEESRVRRLSCNGWLELIMPKVEFRQKPKKVDAAGDHDQKEKEEERMENEKTCAVLHESIDFDEDEVPPLE